jgi:hypothetical protein
MQGEIAMHRIPVLTLALALACSGAAFAADADHTRANHDGTATLHKLGADLKGAMHKLGNATRHALHRTDAAVHRPNQRDPDRKS